MLGSKVQNYVQKFYCKKPAWQWIWLIQADNIAGNCSGTEYYTSGFNANASQVFFGNNRFASQLFFMRKFKRTISSSAKSVSNARFCIQEGWFGGDIFNFFPELGNKYPEILGLIQIAYSPYLF